MHAHPLFTLQQLNSLDAKKVLVATDINMLMPTRVGGAVASKVENASCHSFGVPLLLLLFRVGASLFGGTPLPNRYPKRKPLAIIRTFLLHI